MPNSGLFGPHELDADYIAGLLSGTGPGAYALGDVNTAGKFVVSYIGRSDADLKARLTTHARAGKYPLFKYAFYETANAAWLKECELFHMFGELLLDNEIHPAGAGTCPHCGS